MIVGGGMMAKAFAAFARDERLLVYASGVSDSRQERPEPFQREEDLLRRVREENAERLLVYLGTCSADDPDRRDSPYVRHKLRMEQFLVAAAGPWLVLRLPVAIGPGQGRVTFPGFLYDRIRRGEPFDLWEGATRYPIDVEHVAAIAQRLFADASMHNRRINIALRPYPALAFVQAFERILGKAAIYRRVPRGAHYEIRCPEIAPLLPRLGISADEGYLERVLRKYYAQSSSNASL